MANALLCPDLQHATKSYDEVIFYFDTPLLIRVLGLEGSAKQDATNELINLLRELGGEIATFEHSRKELGEVLRGAASNVDMPSGKGAIITEARRRNTTKSDLLLLAGKIDGKLERLKIQIRQTPQYASTFQIGETAFAQTLEDELSYFNERTRDYDINSVRSIYELRKGKSPRSIEKSRAILVTSNASFARAAWQYGKKHEISYEVSTVITDFSLGNIAWLKAPMGAPLLPKAAVLAYSYAALQPSNKLLNKFLEEIYKLESSGKITPKDHQLLRSINVDNELMDLTLGDEAALTEETVTKTLERITSEIRSKENAKTIKEKQAHDQTKAKLYEQSKKNKIMIQKIYWRCRTRAKWLTNVVSVIIFVLLLYGVLNGIGVNTSNPILGWLMIVGSVVFMSFSLGNLMFGSTVLNIYNKILHLLLTCSLKRETRIMGVDINDVYDDS